MHDHITDGPIVAALINTYSLRVFAIFSNVETAIRNAPEGHYFVRKCDSSCRPGDKWAR